MDTDAQNNIVQSRTGGVLTVTLDRPARRNAINLGMFDELRSAFEEVALDSSVRVVVLRGAGGNFCSGGDLAPEDAPVDDKPLAERTLEVLLERCAPMARALHRLPQPVIAAVEGVAAGAGANLAFGCDFVLAAEGARFSEIFVRRALSLDCGGSWLLPRLVGLRRAKELAFFGDWVEAQQALELGLVNRVVAPAEFPAVVADWAQRLAGRSPLALAEIKRSLDRSFATEYEDALVGEATAQAKLTASADFAEAMSAFLEKREPVFSPR